MQEYRIGLHSHRTPPPETNEWAEQLQKDLETTYNNDAGRQILNILINEKDTLKDYETVVDYARTGHFFMKNLDGLAVTYTDIFGSWVALVD